MAACLVVFVSEIQIEYNEFPGIPCVLNRRQPLKGGGASITNRDRGVRCNAGVGATRE